MIATPFTDIMGKPLDIGDNVVVAFPSGSSAVMRVGTIKELSEIKSNRYDHTVGHYMSAPVPVLVIEWDQSLSYGAPSKPTKMQDINGRFLKL